MTDDPLAAAARTRLPQEAEEQAPRYTSGSTHPEFDDWWPQCGERLSRDARYTPYLLAMAAWMVAWDRAQEQTREMEREAAVLRTRAALQEENERLDRVARMCGEAADRWAEKYQAADATGARLQQENEELKQQLEKVDAEAARYFEDWCKEENRAEAVDADLASLRGRLQQLDRMADRWLESVRNDPYIAPSQAIADCAHELKDQLAGLLKETP